MKKATLRKLAYIFITFLAISLVAYAIMSNLDNTYYYEYRLRIVYYDSTIHALNDYYIHVDKHNVINIITIKNVTYIDIINRFSIFEKYDFYHIKLIIDKNITTRVNVTSFCKVLLYSYNDTHYAIELYYKYACYHDYLVTRFVFSDYTDIKFIALAY